MSVFSLSLSLCLSDVKGYGKVCLSPQRRSFGSGCSWNTSATGSGRDGQSSATSNHRDGPFDSHAEPRRLSGQCVCVLEYLWFFVCVCLIFEMRIQCKARRRYNFHFSHFGLFLSDAAHRGTVDSGSERLANM